DSTNVRAFFGRPDMRVAIVAGRNRWGVRCSSRHRRCTGRAAMTNRLGPCLLLLLAGCERTFDCEKLVPNVQLHVVDDSTSTAIPPPRFSGGTTPLAASCQMPPDGGACPTWQLLVVGTKTITIAAAGYRSATLTLDAGVDQSSLHCGANAGPARRL